MVVKWRKVNDGVKVVFRWWFTGGKGQVVMVGFWGEKNDGCWWFVYDKGGLWWWLKAGVNMFVWWLLVLCCGFKRIAEGGRCWWWFQGVKCQVLMVGLWGEEDDG